MHEWGFEAASRDSPRYLFVALFVQFGIKKKKISLECLSKEFCLLIVPTFPLVCDRTSKGTFRSGTETELSGHFC